MVPVDPQDDLPIHQKALQPELASRGHSDLDDNFSTVRVHEISKHETKDIVKCNIPKMSQEQGCV